MTKRKLSVSLLASVSTSMGPEGFQRAFGKPFGRAPVFASVYCTTCKNSEANYFVNASRPRFRMKESGAYAICSFMGEAVFRCRFGLLKHLFRETHLPQQGNGVAGIGRALHKAVREMHALLRKLLPEMYLGIVF